MLRPLGCATPEAWREVRIRSRDWLEPGSRSPSPARPIPSSTARRSGPAAARGSASGNSTAPTASACSCTTAPSSARSASGASCGAPSSRLRRLLGRRRHAGRAHARGGGGHHALRLRDARLHRIEAAIVPRNSKSRRVAEKLGLRDEGTASASCRSRACGRTTCATRSPAKSGTNAGRSSRPSSSASVVAERLGRSALGADDGGGVAEEVSTSRSYSYAGSCADAPSRAARLRANASTVAGVL